MHIRRRMRSLLAIVAAAVIAAVAFGSDHPTAAQQSGPWAVVTNEFGADIAIIDTATGRITRRVPIAPGSVARARGMAASPDGKLVYIAVTDATYGDKPNPQWEFIGALDVPAGRIVAKFPCGTDPERLAVTPDGRRIYCSNEDKQNATVLDARTGKTLATIPTGIEPEGVGISPDGRWVYVTAETSNSVTIIDAPTNKPVRTLVVGSRPRVAAFAPDGRRAYVSAEAGGTLSVVDVARQAVIRTVTLGSDSKPVGVVVSPDSRQVYTVGGRCNCVFAVDAQTYQIRTVVQRVGRRPWGIALMPDGKTIYTANGRSDDVTVIDAQRLAVVRTIDHVGRGPHSVVIVP